MEAFLKTHLTAQRSSGYKHLKPVLAPPYVLAQLGYERCINELTGTYRIYAKGRVKGFKEPAYLTKYFQSGLKISYIAGPYVFMNGFELSSEGQYLVKLLPLLTPRCRDIIRNHALFVYHHRAYDVEYKLDKYMNEKRTWYIANANTKWSGLEIKEDEIWRTVKQEQENLFQSELR